MQINAQSAIKSPWLEIAKDANQTAATVNKTKTPITTDSVTLSPASLALASGETTSPEMITYGWPVWPTNSSEVRSEQ